MAFNSFSELKYTNISAIKFCNKFPYEKKRIKIKDISISHQMRETNSASSCIWQFNYLAICIFFFQLFAFTLSLICIFGSTTRCVNIEHFLLHLQKESCAR